MRYSAMSQPREFTQADLTNFKPLHAQFVGIDSDGCVFPTMEIKQKQCFHKLIITQWHLEKIEKQLRETAEFVNLYSKQRGTNRFPCLLKTIELLHERPEVTAAGVKLPEFRSLKQFIASGVPLSNQELEKVVRQTGDTELAAILDWSMAVNAEIARTVQKIAPFQWARESLDAIRQNADAICVSQTPTEALMREWQENSLSDYVAIIAGQELGSKAEHLQMAAQNKYAPDNILMIGDAPGDLKAAQSVNGLFFPINPGHEASSWELFHKEAFGKFISGTYRGSYEKALITEFDKLLPATPPWRTN